MLIDSRCVGVLGGVFVCAGYAIRITTRAVEVVSGADQTPGIVAAEASGAKASIRAKWGGSHLHSRSLKSSGKMVPQGSGWVMEGGSGSPYASYNSTPMSTPGFVSSPYTPHTPYTPHLLGNAPPPPASGVPTAGSGIVGLGLAGIPTGSNPGSPNPAFLPLSSTHAPTGSNSGSPNPAYLPLPPTPATGMRSPPARSTSPYGVPSPGVTSLPGTPGTTGAFSPLPNPNGTLYTNGHGSQPPPPPRRGGPRKDD